MEIEDTKIRWNLNNLKGMHGILALNDLMNIFYFPVTNNYMYDITKGWSDHFQKRPFLIHEIKDKFIE